MGREFLGFISEYLLIFFNALYKSGFYTSAILIIKGWMTTNFDSISERYKQYSKRLLFYEIFFSLLINISNFFMNSISKLNLFYLKSEVEQIVFIAFFVYCIIKVMVPLYKQMNYEQSIRSDLAECLKFKYKKLFKVYILFGIHSLVIMISPLIEKEIFYAYLNNYQMHYVFYFFYSVNFCLGLNIIFIPKQLPNHFYDEVIYSYKGFVNLEADIYEGDDNKNNKKLNISNLSFNNLKKASVKDDYPIILIDPFASSKNHLLFNHMHIGIAQRYEDNK